MQTEHARKMIDDQLELLSEALAAGRSEQLEAFLTTMANFHRYSLGNTLLIMVQKPEATHVAGFHRWKELGRTVKKGEKGIAILAPMFFKGEAKEELAEEGCGEESKERELRFRVVYVFDVSQTEGEELPAFARPSGDPGSYLGKLRGLVHDLDIELEYRDDLGGADGLSRGGLIAIQSGLSPAEEFSTLVHELTHEQLHHGERRKESSKKSRELEAEAVAFVVSQAIGLDAQTASSDYIQLYRGDKEALGESLEAIRSVSQRILGALFESEPCPKRSGATLADPKAQEGFSPVPSEAGVLAGAPQSSFDFD